MRSLRIEIATAALILAPLLGYAIGYFFAGEPAPETQLRSTAATMSAVQDKTPPHPGPA